MAPEIVPNAPDEASLVPGTPCTFRDIRTGRTRFGTVERVIRRGARASWLEVSVLVDGGSRRYTLPPERVRARP